MREILYQGKETDSSKWVQGDLVTNGIDYITAIRINDKTSSEYGQIVRVDPETVSEYTGLTDKNGKGIFENNILKITSWVKGDFLNDALKREDIALVEYDSKTGGYRLKVYNDGRYKRISKFTKNHLWAYDAEVIGNKWDNPELLEG